jgi:AraC-like DNA-binding protein
MKEKHIGSIIHENKVLLTMNEYGINPYHDILDVDYHPELEISRTKSGSGYYMADGHKYEIKPGDIFIINNIEPHFMFSIDPSVEMVQQVIMFDPRFIHSVENQNFDFRYLRVFFDRGANFLHKIDRDNPAAEEIRHIFNEMENEFGEKKPEHELMVKIALMRMLVCLLRHYDYTGSETGNQNKRRQDLKLITKVTDHIHTNLNQTIKLEHLAELVFMNPSYFSTFFKKYVGISPSRFIAQKRVNRAVELLAVSNKPVRDIAELCGFNNIANFNKIFKNLMGRVPSDFRK